MLSSLGGGGVQKMLYNYYTHMNRDIIQFDFIVHGEKVGMFEEKFREMGSKIYHVKPKKEGLFQNLCQLRKIIYSKPKYDVVHCHQNLISFIPLYFAKKAGINVRIAHSHTTFSANELGGRIKDSVFRFLLINNANKFVACGVDAAKCLYGKKISINGEVSIIHNAVDESLYRYNPLIREEVRRELYLEDKYVIGHVGRFSEEKNHKFILQIFEEVYHLNKNAVLLLIGDGELEHKIKQLACSLEANNNILFLGLRNDVARLYQAMDVFLLPSHHEGFPVALVEAQVAGLKCFVSTTVPQETNIAALVEYIDLKDGPKVWADKILNSKTSLNRGEKTLDNKEYNIVQVTDRLTKLYLTEL